MWIPSKSKGQYQNEQCAEKMNNVTFIPCSFLSTLHFVEHLGYEPINLKR